MRSLSVVVALLASSPALAGCLSDDGGLSLTGLRGGDPETVPLTLLLASEAGEGRGAGLHALALELRTVVLLPEEGQDGEEVALTVVLPTLDLVAARSTPVAAAAGTAPAGAYRGLRIDVAPDAKAHTTRGEERLAAEPSTTMLLPFEIAEGAEATLTLTLDLDRSVRETDDGALLAPMPLRIAAQAGTSDPAITGAAPAGKIPIARMQVFAGTGEKLFESDFVAREDEGDLPARTRDAVVFLATASEAREPDAELIRFYWDFDDGARAEGKRVEHAFAAGGLYAVRLVVEDSAGAQDDLLVSLRVDYDFFPEALFADNVETGRNGWRAWSQDDVSKGETPPGVGAGALTQWSIVETPDAVSGSRAWYAGVDQKTYTDNAAATLLTPAIALPADLAWAGMRFHVRGTSQACCDRLAVDLRAFMPETEADAAWQPVAIFRGAVPEWVETFTAYGLTEHVGKTVELRFTFRSDLQGSEGVGFYVDDIAIGGGKQALRGGADAADGHHH